MSSTPTANSHPAQPAPQPAPETFGLLGPVLGGIFLLWILIVAAVAQNV
ncbi:hypothetical protein SH611_06900 [Geminicoccaceae bacterium 1502E]|nr:hypothetical protein [Geminicoccaceae bacterium 1502E]